MTAPVEDEFTELVDADIPRVDLVDKAANGVTRFLIAKGEGGAGLLDADYVRDLIGKSEPEPEPAGETVTMTGSPAAIAKMIHEAALNARAHNRVPFGTSYSYGQIVKAKYNADDLHRMAANGQAMDDESYPIADHEDLTRAVRAVGRGGSEHNAIRRHIISRAKSLGASSEIPDNWNSDGSLKEGSVSKMELDESTDGMDPTVVLAAPDGEAPGDPMDPGSPAWEAVDAATAQKWTSILARARAAIDVLAQREMLEAASSAGDCDDAENAMDLDDACCAIDYAISVLAPFAVSEQSESDMGADVMAAVGKALAGFDTAPLDTIEAFAQVRKAGRVLSSANEAAIRGAVDSLQKVLASLPQAPQIPDESGRPVAKEETVTAPAAPAESVEKADAPEEPQAQTETQGAPVEKADGEGKAAQVAVYDQKGKLVGIVDPGDITPIAGAEAEDAEPAEPEAAPAAEAAPEATDLAPAPAAEVGTPADDVGKTADAPTESTVPDTTSTTSSDTGTDAVLKSITDAVTAALDAHSAAQEEVIAKQAADLAGLAETIETLKGRLQVVEEQPAPPKVFTNGAVPPAEMLRGQDRGAQPLDVAKAAEKRQSLYKSYNATEQNRIAEDMKADAIAALQAIHQRPAPA